MNWRREKAASARGCAVPVADMDADAEFDAGLAFSGLPEARRTENFSRMRENFARRACIG
jgi:hypothetical protein